MNLPSYNKYFHSLSKQRAGPVLIHSGYSWVSSCLMDICNGYLVDLFSNLIVTNNNKKEVFYV